MRPSSFNKRKIFNDPVYGFISIPDEHLFNIIEHPYFQRLRRIKQLGLTHLVYPGALHTRFHHSLGAMYLMRQAIESLRFKGKKISAEEETGVIQAILLHDIGHSPYSHTLEGRIIQDMPHEELTLLFMHRLNEEFNGKLDLAIRIFSNTYPWRFLHQLVSSQLDMDRLDFLKRDSFYTGVSEGVINTERIIEMLDVVDDELVVEEKGIYSIEKFIVARRLMYWQVYLHKTVIAAEKMLLRLLERAHTLSHQGHDLFMTPALAHFIRNNYSEDDFRAHPALLDHFALIDDFDIFTSVKVWATHPDNVLRILAQGLLLRHLFRIEIQKEPFDAGYIDMIRANVAHHYGLPEDSLSYFVFTDEISNKAYDPFIEHIRILFKNGQVTEIEETSDQLNIALLTRKVTKYYLCYPKNCLVTH